MGLYAVVVTVPPGTPRESPVEEEVYVEGDVVTHISVLIPPGHMALTGLRIFYGLEQLAPRNPGGWITGDGEVVSWSDYIPLPERKTRLILKAFNEDEEYEHSFYVRIVTMERRYMTPIDLMVDAYSRLIRFLRRLGVR